MNPLKIIPPGTGGRWAIGVIVLTHLVAYDETGGPGAVLATTIAAVSAIFSGICKSGLKNIQIPYLRTTHRFDFLCLFLAMWMDILSLLSACGILARTLSTCLDAMTGGSARINLLGRNSPTNEPWPDVLGVAVIFLVTGMFMLGLENTKIFSFLMVAGVLGVSGILSITTWLRGTSDSWTKSLVPAGLSSVIASAAFLSFAFPCEFPSNGNYKKLNGFLIIFVVFLSNVLTAGCLSTLFEFKLVKEYFAVPILTIFESTSFEKVKPAIVCLLVLGCSGSLLELFPEMFSLFVKLTTSDWKILAKQIGYENRESGSPVLAVFIAGSLCAMLAFACPLEILTYILGGSFLTGSILRGLYLFYSPYRPKYVHQQSDSSLAYSRLNPGHLTQSTTAVSRLKGTLQFFNRSSQSVNQIVKNIPKSKSKVNKKQKDEEVEREWLLLGEPPSPKSATNKPQNDIESSILSDNEPTQSDMEDIGSTKEDNTDTDSSTDIDAIVDEYRQKVKVSTAGPMENIVRIPTNVTWRFAICGVILVMCGIGIAIFGIFMESNFLIICGTSADFIISVLLIWIPKYQNSHYSPSSLTCVMSVFISCILLSFSLKVSWPAVVFWFVSGLILFIRCDRICCSCLDKHPVATQNLIPNVSSKLATIRVPTSHNGSILTSRLSGHR